MIHPPFLTSLSLHERSHCKCDFAKFKLLVNGKISKRILDLLTTVIFPSYPAALAQNTEIATNQSVFSLREEDLSCSYIYIFLLLVSRTQLSAQEDFLYKLIWHLTMISPLNSYP